MGNIGESIFYTISMIFVFIVHIMGFIVQVSLIEKEKWI